MSNTINLSELQNYLESNYAISSDYIHHDDTDEYALLLKFSKFTNVLITEDGMVIGENYENQLCIGDGIEKEFVNIVYQLGCVFSNTIKNYKNTSEQWILLCSENNIKLN